MTVKIKINLEDPTGNFWIDNGIVVLNKGPDWFGLKYRRSLVIMIKKEFKPCSKNLNSQETGL